MKAYDFLSADHGNTEELFELYHSLIGTPGCTWSMEYPDRETVLSDIKDNSLYVLKENGAIIATASASVSDDTLYLFQELQNRLCPFCKAYAQSGRDFSCAKNPCELARVGVLTDYQKRGAATSLLKKVIDASKAKGFDAMLLLASIHNPAAIALYEKLGFTKCGQIFVYEKDFYCYRMIY